MKFGKDFVVLLEENLTEKDRLWDLSKVEEQKLVLEMKSGFSFIDNQYTDLLRYNKNKTIKVNGKKYKPCFDIYERKLHCSDGYLGAAVPSEFALEDSSRLVSQFYLVDSPTIKQNTLNKLLYGKTYLMIPRKDTFTQNENGKNIEINSKKDDVELKYPIVHLRKYSKL